MSQRMPGTLQSVPGESKRFGNHDFHYVQEWLQSRDLADAAKTIVFFQPDRGSELLGSVLRASGSAPGGAES